MGCPPMVCVFVPFAVRPVRLSACPLLSACPPVFIFDMYMGVFDTGGQQLLSAAFYLSALKSPIYQGFWAFGGQADSRWVKIVLLSA